MSTIDLVFEGGGAKGMVFIGALEVLFEEAGHTHGRLLGTSAGAITAMGLAAGYAIPELNAALTEKDKNGKPIFMTFFGGPPVFDADAIRHSAIRKLLAELNIPFVPDLVKNHLDDWIADHLAHNARGRHLFSFIDAAAGIPPIPLSTWAQQQAERGRGQRPASQFGKLTLKEFFDQTQVELTLVAADTTWSRVLWLNHRTAPDCPVV